MSMRALVLDVGGVLVESPFVAALEWGQRWDLPMDAFGALYAEYSKVAGPGEEPPLWHRVECGEVPLAEFVTVVRESLESVLPPGHRARTLQASDFNPFSAAAGHSEMAEVAIDARSAGFATAILTNNVREWADWRDRVPLASFDHVVDSSEVGLRKPDPAIYQLVNQRLDVAAEEVLFLDDHQGNLEAAAEIGWKTLLVEANVAAAADRARELLGLEGAGR